MTTALKLPVGIEDFREIRQQGFYYIDKTKLIEQLLDNWVKVNLFTRPRRFGKTLNMSMLRCFFEVGADKMLFDGLYISHNKQFCEEYMGKFSVVFLTLKGVEGTTFEEARLSLAELIAAEARRFKFLQESDKLDADDKEMYRELISLNKEQSPATSVKLRFSLKNLSELLYKHYGQKTIVLIDEYDKPLLQALSDEKLTEEYRRILKAFYGVLKSADRYLRFVFLTGVTKFAQISVFSDLNQLQDISTWPDYSSLCGITKEELLTTFTPEIERLGVSNGMDFDTTLEQMTKLYDGYHFYPHCEGVFNPFSVLNACKSKILDNFWFQTGTPTYLVNLLKESDYDLRLLIEGVEVTASAFFEYRAEVKNPLPMIYQSGYLTIKAYDRDVLLYTLGFPNDEVRYGFLNFLVPYYTGVTDDETGFHIAKFMRELRSGDVDAFMERLKVFFAGMPYDLSDNTERHYQAIFYVVFTLMGQFVETEIRSARGRADAVVKTKDTIYVFEFKLNGSAEEALRQIDEKGYLIPYRLDGRRLVKVGVNFSKERRNVDRYIVEDFVF